MFKKNYNNKCHECENKENSIFCNIGNNDSESLSVYKGVNLYKRGHIIFLEGTLPTGLYCIRTGKIKITKIGLDGKQQALRFLKEGDVIGYRSLISDDRYQASAIALEDSEVCFFQKNIIDQTLRDNILVKDEIIKRMANDIKLSERNIVDLAQRSVKQRICTSLLNLIEIYGFKKDQKTINMRISRKQISEIVGTTPETTSRLFSELIQEKIISSKRNDLEIINISQLKRSSEF
ncbi:MAG: Crp/Fnr family transcriptional regulator [Flavobacteriales bacterium]|jgi:CRP/FNR family transcriptional regulator, polysaccharide utilization system transcription regulator|nr:Crp/Fnr family transcriptional regulator [Flavobacteriales bacterium]MBT5353542.1 Crp/Fnr family transcriptional regulator [Flavobacteriales bacterium]MBT5698552.1 Crp/Fnr family transcriptional regulator [Flavobacteriales bacterium]MBT6815910.1 Crp/Fnr family transcriptional regulator [Flavobacteriales bacterium]MBT7620142.1 Crp/Fnr family transcriptional regulator [Flavobacteriales bacterium]